MLTQRLRQASGMPSTAAPMRSSELRDQSRQSWTPGDPEQLGLERDAQIRGAIHMTSAYRSFDLPEHGVETDEVGLRYPLRRQTRREALEHLTEQVRLDHLPAGQLRDDETAGRPTDDEVLRLKTLQGLAHGRSAHLEVAGEVLFAQPLSRPHPVVDDRVLQSRVDAFPVGDVVSETWKLEDHLSHLRPYGRPPAIGWRVYTIMNIP